MIKLSGLDVLDADSPDGDIELVAPNVVDH